MEFDHGDQCPWGQYADVRGMPGFAEAATAPAKKPTHFMTDSATIAKRLARQCGGGHRHVQLMEGRAAKAAEYTPELCMEICKGLIEQKRTDKDEVMMLSSM